MKTETLNKGASMKQYIITLKHDNGKIAIRTAAISKEQAVRQVLNAENAPKCAIVSVRT